MKLPRKLPNGTRAWTSRHYNKAANAVMDAIGISPVEWGEVRLAIRKALEKPAGKPGAGNTPANKMIQIAELDSLVGKRLLSYRCSQHSLTYVRERFELDLFFDGFGDAEARPTTIVITCEDGRLTLERG